jgi:hypothetical protein
MMPSISMFYGIIVTMFFEDNKQHNKPHIHVRYQEYEAVFEIFDGEVIDGKLPKNKLRLVQAWIELHRDELIANWELAVAGRNVYPIEPLK